MPAARARCKLAPSETADRPSLPGVGAKGYLEAAIAFLFAYTEISGIKISIIIRHWPGLAENRRPG